MGKILIFSAPSGAGKTTIVREMLKQDFRLEFSISACTRQKREGEEDGKDYYFLTVDEFKQQIENDKFLEWEEVYSNHFYGTLKSETERIFAKRNNVIFDVDVVGGVNLKKYFGNKALSIFIMPPSINELRKRLTNRSTDSLENIEKRLQKAKKEMKYADKFDRIILNDNLESVVNETTEVVRKFLQI